MPDSRTPLLTLAHALGDDRRMATLGEGNVSARLDEDRFLVKASGTQMATLEPHQLVEVRFEPLLKAMQDERAMDDDAMQSLLLAARVDAEALKPSVESLFHAWLLHLPGVRFVGHVHPIAVNQVVCSPRLEEFATQRLFPDQIVYCGARSVVVPYVDPGLALAGEIARQVDAFIERHGYRPLTILLENHGAIALGESHHEVEAALGMLEKSADVFVGAAALGGPVFMDPVQVERIAGRPDEHYRQQMMEGHRSL